MFEPIDVTDALYQKLCSINKDERVFRTCEKGVTVLMSEKYREIIALQEKDKNTKIQYPIIVIYDGNIDYDRNRFYNNIIQGTPYTAEYKGRTVYRRKIKEAYMPYNLNYRIEIICKQRIMLDPILLWVMEEIPARGCLDIPYKDEDNNDAIYESLITRGNIIKADEGTSSVLYRRTFELIMTTLFDGKTLKEVTLAEDLQLQEKDMKGDGNNG